MESKEEKKQTDELKIMEWRHCQFLGEKLTIDQFKNDPENDSFLVTHSAFSQDGQFVVVSDKGGRIIIFKKGESKLNKQPRLDYHYEFAAHEKDFDVHKSIEYTEDVRHFSILPPSSKHKLDILSAGYRTIKLDRIYKAKSKTYDTDLGTSMIETRNGINVPKLKHVNSEIKHKTKKVFKFTHNSEINSVNVMKHNPNNFLSSDEFKIFLWDFNVPNEVYNVVDIDPTMEVDNPERITKSVVAEYNPSIFAYGTDKGNLRLCDLRTSSEQIQFTKNFSDENSSLNKTVFANSLLAVHDINMGFSNNYSIATRHYLSVNLWDIRKQNEPTNKFLVYEPIINKLSYLYQNNYLNDKFSLSVDNSGKYVLTGGYNNMFHVLDVEQRLNTQITIDDSNEKLMNTNVIRKINSKGSCFYKKDEPAINNINFDKKILHQAYSPIDNVGVLIVLNCIYTYTGSITKKDTEKKKK